MTLHIHFATMTGNAETLAREALKRTRHDGWDAHLHNLVNVTPEDLGDQRLALFVVSTWGDGEPPDEANDFWHALESGEFNLSGLRFAVFGLGDHDYPEFNAFARLLDERLVALGAHRLLERAEAGLDFEDLFAAWLERISTRLALEREAARI